MKKIIALMMVSLLCLSLCACGFSMDGMDSLVNMDGMSGNGSMNGLSGITLSETNINLNVGDSKNLTVSVYPENMQTGSLTWSSMNESVATVNNGTVVAVGAGSTVVSVSAEGGVSASCNVTVNNKEITSITLDKSSVTLDAGSGIQLVATVSPAGAPTDSLKWSSANDAVATVNSNGYVTGVKSGTVNIYCKSHNGLEASCTVTVEGDDAPPANNNSNNSSSNSYFNPNYTYSASDFIFPDSSSRKLTRTEVKTTLANRTGYSPANSYAQDAINEIYARNGYVFKSAELRQYYESKPWYYANPNFTTADFTSIEKHNIGLFEEFD